MYVPSFHTKFKTSAKNQKQLKQKKTGPPKLVCLHISPTKVGKLKEILSMPPKPFSEPPNPIVPIGDKCFFLSSSMSIEVRQDVYRYLLLNHGPINVLHGWSQVHRRQQSDLDPAILRTCRLVFDEAVRVLYSENWFRYLLRDKAEMVNFEDGKKNAHERTLPLKKYIGLFRKLDLDLESNRTEKDYGALIARAISIPTDLGANLHMLTINISPRRDVVHGDNKTEINEDKNKQHNVSMVRYFEKSGPLIAALKALSTTFIQVKVFLTTTNSDSARCLEMVIDKRFFPSELEITFQSQQLDSQDVVEDEECRRLIAAKLTHEALEKANLQLDRLGTRIQNAYTKGAGWVIHRGWFKELQPSVGSCEHRYGM